MKPFRNLVPARIGRWAGAAAAVVLAATLAGSSLATASTRPLAAPAVVPTSAVVGTGQFNCDAMTGEVGYTTPSIAGGTATEIISIWFQATKCVPVAGGTAAPLPKTVTGSVSFTSNNASACPQLGTLGTGTLNLAFNYPAVPSQVIDPSVAIPVKVSDAGALWNITGGTVLGSYPSTTFSGQLKPNPIGGQNCGTGITSEYITRGTLTNV